MPALALTFPALTGRVVDQANIIPPSDRSSLDRTLAALEQKSSDQLIVVTLPSLEGTDIASYGYQLGRQWGIGQAKLNNGALLIIAPSERKVRIEVGYGLEGTLTDALSSLIIQRAILPKFKAGDVPGGIKAGVAAIQDVLTGNDAEWQQRRRVAYQVTSSPDPKVAIYIIAFVMIFFILAIVAGWFSRTGRSSGRTSASASSTNSDWNSWSSSSSGSGSSSGGSSSGSSSSSSSDDNFSPGGGSFGGGGSSGSW